MYPYDFLFDGFNLYVLFITLGVIAALVVFRILADKNKFPAGLQNLVLIGAVISVVVGYCFAVLFQGVYNAFETGKFVINGSTGATFYGGLIGGAGIMLLIYFLGGKLILKIILFIGLADEVQHRQALLILHKPQATAQLLEEDGQGLGGT